MTTNGPGARRRLLLALTVAGLGFQLGHLYEHTAQMVMWALHPQRAAWMSPWATDLSLMLGRIRNDRIAETTTEMQRGMELLHLVGNGIFLVGAIALWRVVARASTAGHWARAAMVVQALHLLEHVALTASLYLTSSAIGLSTGFGILDGTRLSTHRVWWHGSINLLATGLCAMAVLRALRPGDQAGERLRPLRRPVPVALAGALIALAAPLAMALAMGRPVEAATGPGHDHAAAPIDTGRDGTGSGFELVDVAGEIGLSVEHHAFAWDVTPDPVAMMGGGLCWLDVDRDGWLDLFVTDSWSDGEWGLWDADDRLPTQRIFRNVGGVFSEYTTEWGVGEATRANGCVAADLDNDGYTDLYVTTSRANLLFWNEHGTGFTEGAAAAGADSYGWHTGVGAGDLDGDGNIDLVVAGYADRNNRRSDATTGFPNTFEPIPDLILLNNGPGGQRPTFTSTGSAAGLEPTGPEYGLGVSLLDVDADGDLDVHVANDTQPNRLYQNQTGPDGTLKLVDQGAAAGAADPNSGMGVASADLNRDERPDLVVTNLAGQGHAGLVTMAGRGDLTEYQPGLDPVRRLGLERTGWGASFGDLDLDGDDDLVVASGAIPITDLDADAEPLTVFCAVGDGGALVLEDSTTEVGADSLPARNGRAVALADYDNDGDLDVAVSAIGQPLALLQNRSAQGHWLGLDPGVPLPGLTFRAHLADGRVVATTAVTGGSWLSSEDPRLHLGLGAAEQVPTVEAVVAGKVVRTWTDVEADQLLRLDEP